MKSQLPVIAVTMGDSAGIGPEIIAKALLRPEVYTLCRPFIIGDRLPMERELAALGYLDRLKIVKQVADCDWSTKEGEIRLLDLSCLSVLPAYGKLSAEAGNASYRYVEEAVRLGLARQIDAICTAPLNKEAMQMGGHRYPGHTEILASLCGVEDYAMMLAAPSLRVIHVTTHVGLLDAIAQITPQRVYRVLRLAFDTLQRGGIAAPRIAVCGINPHAGEGGLFGRGEEESQIIPGVERARSEGIDAVGPLPADTLFYRAVRGDFDVVAAMYHDQGHGPVKVLGLEAGVNITVGLPIVRTSVDHGTAFDIAGTGRADDASLLAALRHAAELAPSDKNLTK